MTQIQPFPCCMVRRDASGQLLAGIETIGVEQLPPGDVLIRVAYSSLNFKDALAMQGHTGVVRSLPHVPGIDCAGTVVESASLCFTSGDEVLVTGYELGAGRWGGLSAYVRVPADWVVTLPAGLSPRDAMIYGTAGFTAAQCVAAIVTRGIEPARGPVVVSGATGGVGCLAVAILAKLGYYVEAVSGKLERKDWLQSLGASAILSRSEVLDDTSRPLLAARWAAAIDTVGGKPLETILRSIQHRGCIAACGLVAGDQLHTTVYPFILRGLTLAGIDSAKCPRKERLEIWNLLASSWRIEQLSKIAEEIPLDQAVDRAQELLRGKGAGRTIVAIGCRSVVSR